MIKILHIEDDPFWIEETKKSFDKERFTLINFTSIREALDYIKDNDKFDLILLDLCLPDSNDPFKTLDTILPLVPYTPVIIMTSLGDDEQIAEKAYSLNAEELLAKSAINQDTLIKLVTIAIKRHKIKVGVEIKKSMNEMMEYLEKIKEKLLDTEKTLISYVANIKKEKNDK